MLMRARRQYYDEMQPKDWGLVQCNDPSIIFATTPYLYTALDKLDNAMDAFSDEILCTPKIGYDLYSAFCAYKKPFSLLRLFAKHHAYEFSNQLYILLAVHIMTSSPYTEDDPFIHMDEYCNTDYTFDPKLP
jgi:hypothetical protein